MLCKGTGDIRREVGRDLLLQRADEENEEDATHSQHTYTQRQLGFLPGIGKNKRFPRPNRRNGLRVLNSALDLLAWGKILIRVRPL